VPTVLDIGTAVVTFVLFFRRVFHLLVLVTSCSFVSMEPIHMSPVLRFHSCNGSGTRQRDPTRASEFTSFVTQDFPPLGTDLMLHVVSAAPDERFEGTADVRRRLVE